MNEIKARVGSLSKTEEIFQKNEKAAIDEFEKQMRLLIDQILSNESPHYWKILSSEIRASVEPRIKNWLKSNPTKKREDILPLDFCLIFEYYDIIILKWKKFKPFFGDQKELEKHISNINSFRNALMHSREVDIPTKKLAEASLIWFENIFEKKHTS